MRTASDFGAVLGRLLAGVVYFSKSPGMPRAYRDFFMDFCGIIGPLPIFYAQRYPF
jgi:hypothetical protein